MKDVYKSWMDDWCHAGGQLLGYGAPEKPGELMACDLCGKQVQVVARFGDFGYPAYPRHKPPGPGSLTANDRRFLSLWPQQTSPWLSLEAASDALGVSPITAAAALSRLRKKGLVRRIGSKNRDGGAVTYLWTTTEHGDAVNATPLVTPKACVTR